MKIILPLFSLALATALSAADTIKIGVAWDTKSAMPERVAEGLTNTLARIAPQIEVEMRPTLKDQAELDTVVKGFQQTKQGMVVLRSSGAKYLAKNPPAIPAFVGACGDPQELGAVKDTAAPEGKITGVTYAVPYATVMQTFKGILPGAKSVLLLVEEGHPSAPLNQAGIKAACEKLGLQYTDKACKTFAEAQAAAKEADGKVSMVVLGAQALLIDHGGEVARSIATPAVSLTEKPVADGALCGVVANDVKLGGMLAESVVDVLVKGKAVKEVPVKTDPQPQLLLNSRTATKLKVEIPYEILSVAKLVE